MRVLGVARGVTVLHELPMEHHDLELELVGLLGFEDPLRPTVPAAVADCQSAGIRVVMITGDYPQTARTIAERAGLSQLGLMTGSELETLSESELASRISEIGIFARVVPEQKLRIVQALKANGDIVAMTGDGVNDAPALKAAHIGVAMGERGTDVAREAAGLVLLDDDFSSIVAAVRTGRRIYDNIRKAVAFVLAVHMPIAGLSILPVFVKSWPMVLLPVHIAFLELIIDPACTLVFEAEKEEAELMKRPPRKVNERLFSRRTVALSVAQGIGVWLFCSGIFLGSHYLGYSDGQTRALTFGSLVFSLLLLILVNRSWAHSAWELLKSPNKAFRWGLLGAVILLALVSTVPFLARMFHFETVPLKAWVWSLPLAPVSLIWFEIWKARGRSLEMLTPKSLPIGRDTARSSGG